MGGEDMDMSDLDFDDVGGGEDDSKPFDDEEFNPGVEASEEEEPKKFVQQLTGKLSQSLRSLSKEEGVDKDLEQYVINMVLDATHPEELEDHERQEIIDRIDQEKEEPGEPEMKDDEEGGEEELPQDDTNGVEGDEDENSIEDELGDELKGDENAQEK